MQRFAWLAAIMVLSAPSRLADSALLAQAPAESSSAQTDCGTSGNIRFVCARRSEDILHVPGTDWVLLSTQGLRALNVRDKSLVTLYPSDTAQDRHDKATYAECPGPVAGAARTAFGMNGISVLPAKGGNFMVFGTHPGAERAVDVFELDMSARTPRATWVGCVLAPAPISLNSIVALPDGGFIGTNWLARGEAGRGFRPSMEQGAVSGEVWEWHAAGGWVKVPGSEGAGNNGVEVSRDGRWLYINEWGAKSFYRLSRGASPPTRQKIDLGFRPDNVHWAPDGMLLVAGHTNPDQPTPPSTRIVKIDPNTLAVTELLNLNDTPEFQHATGAVQVGGDIWAVSVRSDRIAVFPAPR